MLRPALLPGPAARGCVQRRARQRRRRAVRDAARCSRPPAPGETLPDERRASCRGRAPVRSGEHPHEPDRTSRYRRTRSRVVAAIADELRLADWRLVAADDAPGFHPVRAAAVLVDDGELGVVGEVAPEVIDALELAGTGGRVRARRRRAARGPPASRVRPEPVSRFPASAIDLAFVVDDTVPAGDVLAHAARDRGGDLARVGRAVRRVPFRRARCRSRQPRVRDLRSARRTARSPTTRSPGSGSS